MSTFEYPDWSDHQRCLYDYDAEILELRIIKAGGVLSTSLPSPLTRAAIEPVLLALAELPAYEGQKIICHDHRFNPVIMRDGRILPAGDE
jgi:hypothetical protein